MKKYIPVIIFFLVIIGGIKLIDARVKQINEQEKRPQVSAINQTMLNK